MKNKTLFFFLFLLLSSCASNPETVDALGVYSVVERLCSGTKTVRDSCNKIVFVELVKGRFHGVSASDTAFVTWSGEEDLDYHARKVDRSIVIHEFPFVLEISRNLDFIESFRLLSNHYGLYSYGNKGTLSKLSLRRASRQELNQYSKSYPGEE